MSVLLASSWYIIYIYIYIYIYICLYIYICIYIYIYIYIGFLAPCKPQQCGHGYIKGVYMDFADKCVGTTVCQNVYVKVDLMGMEQENTQSVLSLFCYQF